MQLSDVIPSSLSGSLVTLGCNLQTQGRTVGPILLSYHLGLPNGNRSITGTTDERNTGLHEL